MDTIDRIFNTLAKSGLSQIELADKLGIKKNAISQWKSRVSKSYTKYLPQIAEVLGTTVQWLVTGEELPQEKKASPPEGELAKLLQEPLMEDIYDAALKLSPESRKIILAQIRAVQGLEADAEK